MKVFFDDNEITVDEKRNFYTLVTMSETGKRINRKGEKYETD